MIPFVLNVNGIVGFVDVNNNLRTLVVEFGVFALSGQTAFVASYAELQTMQRTIGGKTWVVIQFDALSV